ncbi:replication initiator [Streptomyces sp. CH6]|uniref:replication initiator n=1 Tax=Streptomyces sp. CH6 TaxID=3420320 RepID=UPI003D06ED18
MRSYSTDTEPTGNLLTTCGNCRTSRCPAYSRFWAADTYHLMRADLTGGKTFRIPVLRHPHHPLLRSPPQPRHRPCRCGTHHEPTGPWLGTLLNLTT